MKNQKEVESAVNHLLEICNERKAGYRKAAENVKDSSLKTLFEKYAQQSEKFAQELLPFSDKSEPSEAGTRVIADTWRVWMDMKSALTKGSREALVEASITGEQAAIRDYEDALEDKDIPINVRSIVEKQLSAIKSAYQDIKMKKSV